MRLPACYPHIDTSCLSKTQSAIGWQLSLGFEKVRREPLPKRFADLLRQLEAHESPWNFPGWDE